MAFQMLLFTIFLVGIDRRPHEIPALVIIHNILRPPSNPPLLA
jgi:hypothetical protein